MNSRQTRLTQKNNTKPLQEKTVVLGVTGSVAAIKSAKIARLLREKGATVHAVLTQSGKTILSPQQLAQLEQATGNKLLFELFDENTKAHIANENQRQARGPHIDLAEKADLLLIAPATANTIANLAHGKTQDEQGNADLLSTLHLGLPPHKLAIAPAMHTQMWNHPATRENIETLQKRGAHLIPPTLGKLASGDVGEGRMQEPEKIVAQIQQMLLRQTSLEGKKILVNAGPTRAYIDDVRFISNPFSGALGIEIARQAAQRGAKVVLLQGAGKEVPPEIHGMAQVEHFKTPQDLEALMKKHVKNGQDAIIHSSAINDYAPVKQSGKIKSGKKQLTLTLSPLPKLIDKIRPWEKESKLPKTLLVKFKLETGKTEDEMKKIGIKSMNDSDADMIVLNSKEWINTQTGIHKTIILNRQGKQFGKANTKQETAKTLLDAIEKNIRK